MTGDDEDSGVFCDADGVDGAGFVNNESDSEGGALWVDSTDSRLQIQSSSCDWGTGGSDNRDFDIGMPHHRVIADGEVTFVCNGTVCSSTVESYGVIFVEEITLF